MVASGWSLSRLTRSKSYVSTSRLAGEVIEALRLDILLPYYLG